MVATQRVAARAGPGLLLKEKDVSCPEIVRVEYWILKMNIRNPSLLSSSSVPGRTLLETRLFSGQTVLLYCVDQAVLKDIEVRIILKWFLAVGQ